MSIFSSYKKIFLLGFIAVTLVVIPFSVYVAQQRQQTKSQAAKSTTLSFEPKSPTVKVNEILTLNIVLNPNAGTTTPSSPNQVSFVKLVVGFDQTKFETLTDGTESLTPSKDPLNKLTSILEDPVYTPTTASISLSVGADPANVLETNAKIAVLKLKAKAVTNVPTEITLDGSQVLSIASTDGTSENVLSSVNRATVTIAGDSSTTIPSPTLTSAPSSTSSATANKSPACTALGLDRASSGTAPYSITFTATGNDTDGTISKVTFNFGDSPVQDITQTGGIGTNSVSVQTSHTYNNPGIYKASATLTDNNGTISTVDNNCSQTITVATRTTTVNTSEPGEPNSPATSFIAEVPETPTPASTVFFQQPSLPPTGPGAEILGIGIIGVIITAIGGLLLILL